MEIQSKNVGATGIKFYVEKGGKEIGRAFLYILSNELHKRPFGFMEDVFIDEDFRGNGIGSEIVKKIIEEAKKLDCYKLICASKHKEVRTQKLYFSLGFEDNGKELRVDL